MPKAVDEAGPKSSESIVFLEQFMSDAVEILHDGFEEDGEGLNIEWQKQTAVDDHLLSTTFSAPHAGERVLRVYVHKDDPYVANGPRSEYSSPQNIGYFSEGDEVWLALSVYFPNDYIDDSEYEIIWQLHGDHNSPGVPFLVRSVGDKLEIMGQGIDNITIPKTKGQWMNIAVHHLFSSSNSGITEAFVNTELVTSGTNISNMRPDQNIYWKFGMYKSGWKNGNDVNPNVVERTLYFDDVYMGLSLVN